VFIGKPKYVTSFGSRWQKKGQLNFDQDACAYFLLQMNSIQETFDFQVIALDLNNDPLEEYKTESLEEVRSGDIVNWFDEKVKNFEKRKTKGTYKIDYWIGITSKNAALTAS
jgi:hypothetical protein